MKRAQPGPSLFDVLDAVEASEPKPLKDPAKCSHKKERKTFTVWPGESFDRMTWTCDDCGRIRGRA